MSGPADSDRFVKVYVSLTEHPKTAGLTDAAIGAFVRCLIYARQNLTDGMIGETALRRMFGSHWRRQPSLTALVNTGMLDPEPEGYSIHDYAAYQQTKDEVNRRSKMQREKALLRWNRDASGTASGTADSTSQRHMPAAHASGTAEVEIEIENHSLSGEKPHGRARPAATENERDRNGMNPETLRDVADTATRLLGCGIGPAGTEMIRNGHARLGELLNREPTSDDHITLLDHAAEHPWWTEPPRSATVVYSEPNITRYATAAFGLTPPEDALETEIRHAKDAIAEPNLTPTEIIHRIEHLETLEKQRKAR